MRVPQQLKCVIPSTAPDLAHRNKRSKSQIHSALDDINGIGEKTKDTLIKKFKSVKRIKEQTEEELAEVIGKAKAKIIFDNLHQN